jgi:exopolysaccharide biosynthesis polyprenyl glycosylphosphotransferase
LGDLSHRVHIDEIVIASFDVSADQMEALIAEPAMAGVRVRAVPEIFGLPPSKVEIGSFAGFPVLTLFENPVRGIRWKLKRAVDLAVASTALVLLSPLLGAIALAISLTTRGPILFRQERVGMDGKRFTMLKFRSMVADAPEAYHRELMSSLLSAETAVTPHPSGFFKAADDPRVTPLGRLLRRFSLDELPQLLNVLRGEMSLVGPRPALAYEVALYKEWQRRRLHVLPGITGLWQVSGRSRLSPTDMLRLDVHYAETWSLPSDIKIILQTIPAILRDDAR